MPSTVQRFFQVLSEIVPNYKEYLNPPCDPSLFAEIENLIGEELPAAFKEFYSIADGEDFNNCLRLAFNYYYFMPLSSIIGCYVTEVMCASKYALKTDKSNIEVENYYKQSSEVFGDYISKTFRESLYIWEVDWERTKNYDYHYQNFNLSYNGNRVKSHIIFHKKWLPFAHSEGGSNYYSLDYAPADEGAKGQIFSHSTCGDQSMWLDYASSFEEYIQFLTNTLLENKEKYIDTNDQEDLFSFNEGERSHYELPIDNIQKEKFDNLPFEWKEYFKTITPTIKNNQYCYDEEATLEQLSEMCGFSSIFVTEDKLKNQFKGILPRGYVMEDAYKHLLQDITPLILMPRMKELRFWFEISLSQFDFVSKYLTQIYKISIPNVFQQEDLKIIGKFKRLFELHLNCGKIDDFSDLLSCKDLARLTLNSAENLNLSALSGLKELRLLDITGCASTQDFSVLSAFKGRLNLQMTHEQFLQAHTYIDKHKIKPTLIVPYGVVEAPITEEQQTIISKWFDK